jgi:excisionase family DNA binding protein
MNAELGDMTSLSGITEGDQKEILNLYSKIQKSRAKLVGPDGKSHNLPDSLYKFLVQLILDLHEGKSVSIIQRDATMTTAEAGRLLGVSRQYIIKLLQRNEIPHQMVGTHRRMFVRDVLAFKAKRDAERRRALDDLARAETEERIYDVVDDAQSHE